METKELKIQIPEGYCVDKSKSTFEKIVFKKKDTKPRSWKEYCRLQKKSNAMGYFINSYCGVSEAEWSTFWVETNEWKSTIPSKELAEAFLAMMQLMSLRQDWIHKWSIDNEMTDDWEPDWTNRESDKWCIKRISNTISVFQYTEVAQTLSFPTKEVAVDFMNCFKDLLEVAKPLI